MAMGHRSGEQQQDLFVQTAQLPKSIGHVFYRKLNELLAEAPCDRWVENLCETNCAKRKRRSARPAPIEFIELQ